jgi:hypothetical protein
MLDRDRSRHDRRSAGDSLAEHGATAALASGILAGLGTVSLVLFGIVEAPGRLGSGATEPSSFVRLSDAFGGLATLVAIPAAFRLHAAWRIRATRASRAALALGLASLAGYAVVVLPYAAGINEPTIQGPLTVVGLGSIGLWILLVSLGRADPALDGNLRRVGVATGLGNLVLFVAYFVGGGSSAVDGQQLVPGSLLLLVAYAAGSVSSQIGYPIWAILLGRRLWAGRGRVDASRTP